MSWDPPGLWPAIILNFGVAIFVGLLLLTLQWGWNILGKRRRRKAAIEDLREFFREWVDEIIATADDEDWQFVRHEQMLRKMKYRLTLIRPDLSNRQIADITELILSHEELIDSKRQVFSSIFPDLSADTVPGRYLLLPCEYQKFFKQSIEIKWLKPGKSKARKKVDGQRRRTRLTRVRSKQEG